MFIEFTGRSYPYEAVRDIPIACIACGGEVIRPTLGISDISGIRNQYIEISTGIESRYFESIFVDV